MTPDNFCFWLQGFFELTGETKLTDKQIKMIKEHLQLVFQHVTGQPEAVASTPVLTLEDLQKELEKARKDQKTQPSFRWVGSGRDIRYC